MNESLEISGEQTIAAFFSTASQAIAAVAELKAAGIRQSAVVSRSDPATSVAAISYDGDLNSGLTVVTIKVAVGRAAVALDIVEAHNPVDIDERDTGFGRRHLQTAPRPEAGDPGHAKPNRRDAPRDGITLATIRDDHPQAAGRRG